ncbi:glycoside hydrolase [Streptomyces sp. NBC_01167]|uniref:sialidase family protein n=1 Tax=Streptomyces sp. NBC_01167 TaxID=2903756 RepID=UPI00386E92D3|nr:glycoside hydrolase [Streptomyces sp. NBC_01167]
MRHPAALLATALLPLIALSTAGTAFASGGGSGPVRLSGPSPFAGCAPGAADGLMAEGAIEPGLASDPSRPGRMAAVWPQDRQRGLVVAVTKDGGRTWKRSVVPGLTRCSGGHFDYVDEPAVTFTGDGGLVVSGGLFMADGSDSAGLSVRSDDDGATWAAPAVIAREPDPAEGGVAAGPVVVDPRSPRVMYAVTPRFPATERSRNQALIARSSDGGRTWQSPHLVVDSGEGHMVSGHRLSVLPDGTLVDVYTLIRFGGPVLSVQATRSTDGGRTWSAPVKVSDLRTKWLFQDPESGEQVSHTTSLLSDSAVDPRTGRMYAAWQDARFSSGAADGVALSSSGDGGRTWSEPVKVNRTPAGIPAPHQQAFTVSLDVARDGTVGVAYSDFRHNDARAPLFTDRWLVRCRPLASAAGGCHLPTAGTDRGSARWKETRLTPESFDMRQAPRIPDASSPRGYFLGEQMGLAATGRGFAAAWAVPDVPGSAAVHVRPAA